MINKVFSIIFSKTAPPYLYKKFENCEGSWTKIFRILNLYDCYDSVCFL